MVGGSEQSSYPLLSLPFRGLDFAYSFGEAVGTALLLLLVLGICSLFAKSQSSRQQLSTSLALLSLTVATNAAYNNVAQKRADREKLAAAAADAKRAVAEVRQTRADINAETNQAAANSTSETQPLANDAPASRNDWAAATIRVVADEMRKDAAQDKQFAKRMNALPMDAALLPSTLTDSNKLSEAENTVSAFESILSEYEEGPKQGLKRYGFL